MADNGSVAARSGPLGEERAQTRLHLARADAGVPGEAKRALKLASAYGRDWYLRVERLQDPAVRDSWFDDSDEALPRPVRLVRVHADGREEILRGGRFSGVQRFALSANLAVGVSPLQASTAESVGIFNGKIDNF